MNSNNARLAFVLALLLGLPACGGGGGGGGGSGSGGSTSTPPQNSPTNASPGGIWVGTDSVSGLGILGLVTEEGEFHFIRDDDVQYTGTVTTTGNSIDADLDGITPSGYVFADGSSFGTGTVSGTLVERESISGTVDFTTSNGSTDSGSLSLTYDALYDRDSSLATIAGNYLDLSTGSVVSINANGEIFSQNPDTGCVVNGGVSIIDARYNAYRTEWTYESCAGQSSFLNGLTFRGLATLDNTNSIEYGVAGATATSGSVRYSVVLVFERT